MLKCYHVTKYLHNVTTLMFTTLPMPSPLRNLLHLNNLSVLKLGLQFLVRNMTSRRIRTLPPLPPALPVEAQKYNLHTRAPHKLHEQHHQRDTRRGSDKLQAIQ